jgi:KTSC domain
MAYPCAIVWKRLSPERGLSKMHRFPVPSKEITQVGYQEDSEVLEIQFVKGGVYQFFNVPSNVFDEFMKAPSKEGYYHSKIGERFPCSRVA